MLCEIEQQYHGTVMGAKGSEVQMVMIDYNMPARIVTRRGGNR